MMAMDNNVYKQKMREVKIYFKRVLTLIIAFSPDNVTSLLDRDQLYINLQRIKDKFLEATDWLAETIVDLEMNNEEARICMFENLFRGGAKKDK